MPSDHDPLPGAQPPAEGGQPVSSESGFRPLDPQKAARRRRSKPGPVGPGGSMPVEHRTASSDRAVRAGQPASPAAASSNNVAVPQAVARPHSVNLPPWFQAGSVGEHDRAPRWQGLKSPDVGRFQLSQLATFLAVPLLPLGLHALWFTASYFWMRFATGVLRWSTGIPSYQFPVPGIFHPLMVWTNELIPLPGALLGLAQGLDVLVLAALTFFGAPYFLRLVLQRFYQVQPFSIARLAQVSPEAQRRVQSYCQKANCPLPQFEILPNPAPIAFTYGTGPKTARMVLSQGLLDQLSDDEIAAVCSGELRYIHPLNVGLMSWILALLQVPYLIYVMTAQLADYLAAWSTKQSNRVLEILPLVGVYLLALVSSAAYITFKALRWTGLWFTRQRSRLADFAAANWTGNPNGQARALLKIAYGLSQDIQTQRHTDFLLEGFELVMPVGYRQAMTLGSLFTVMPIEQALAWDWSSSQRHYLTFNNSHALLGERLVRLMQYAQQWQLPPVLDMQQYAAQQELRVSSTRQQLFVAGLPFWSAVIGYGLALLLWGVAWISFWLGFQQLAWLGSDFRPMYAFPLIGFGLGTLIRFNRYFPDLPQSWQRRPPEPVEDLTAIVQDPLALPHRAAPTALTGQLIGRKGVANWLGQDLLLQSQSVLVRLHYASYLGWLTNLLWAENRATDLWGQAISVIGWFRHGATPWVDAELLRNQYGKTRRGGHQVWVTIVGILAVVVGIIWLGGLEDLIAVIERAQATRR
ncbi:M48 family metalloprotease [filamentous cyanobacterium LEGE 11480]|uniref:M48 family metalloprotease n=1 Tax=Romeriopsis navalis LEGE 11480 TaxID=2777977 RepID=A0A928VIQ4_9CYAN|nr:M48 family metalloprotease [Romeriopsis navalis]MBE9029070.1 M48 family metalloprotease [Romeriopsis navalis LEGE 11480]